MGPPEAALMWRVKILRIIRVLMMVPVVRGPPKRAALSRTGTKDRKHELPEAVGLERFVGKITMVETGNSKHPRKKEGDCEAYCERTGT